MTTLPTWDANYDKIAANQEAVAVSQSGNTVTISGNLDSLEAFESSAGAGTHKWVGIAILTNLPTIVGATWNDSAMTQTDADEAAGLGIGDGGIIFWAAAESLPKTVTIANEGYNPLTLTFNFENA